MTVEDNSTDMATTPLSDEQQRLMRLVQSIMHRTLADIIREATLIGIRQGYDTGYEEGFNEASRGCICG